MRRWMLLVMMMATAARASAQPAPPGWDRVYLHGGYAGSWPCPEPIRDVTVAGGRFSIPWDVSVDSAGTRTSVNLGHIDGTVNADGTATANASLFNPFPRAFLAQASRSRIAISNVRNLTLTVAFKLDRDGGKIAEVSGGGCTVTWRAEPDKPAPPPDKPPAKDRPPVVDCNSGAYAVALWVEGRDYKAGAFARFPSQPGQPTRLFRCANGCAAGKSPADWDGTWAFVGQCQPHS